MSDQHGHGWSGAAGPQQPLAAASADVLAGHDPDADQPRPARWAVVALAGALVLALVGGVSWAVGSLSGGGAQPEDALPAGAVAFAKVDLDPPAGQKIDGFRFLRSFPALRDRVPLDGDVRRVLFEAFAEAAGWQDVDFDTDVDPWLGDRLGVAGYPARAGGGTGQPGPADAVPTVVALQVTDAGKAEAGLRRLVAASAGGVGGSGSVGFVVEGDYALVAESHQLAEAYARRAAEASLADDERYAADVAELGDGVAAVWVDGAAVGEAGRLLDPTGLGIGGVAGLGSAAGRTTMVARFAGPDVFELVGSVSGVAPGGWATHPVTGLGDLPESTVLAVGLADGQRLVPRMVDALRDAARGGGGGPSGDDLLAQVEQATGIEVPEDLAVLLGENLVAALDAGDDAGSLEGAVRVRTDAARARRLLAPLLREQGEQDTVLRTDGDTYLLATSAGQARRMLAGGTLGDRPELAAALPDLATADVAVWADPEALVQALFAGWTSADEDPSPDSGLGPVAAVGLTASSHDDGTGAFRFRIVTR